MTQFRIEYKRTWLHKIHSCSNNTIEPKPCFLFAFLAPILFFLPVVHSFEWLPLWVTWGWACIMPASAMYDDDTPRCNLHWCFSVTAHCIDHPHPVGGQFSAAWRESSVLLPLPRGVCSQVAEVQKRCYAQGRRYINHLLNAHSKYTCISVNQLCLFIDTSI